MTVHIKKRHLYKIRYPCEICPPGKSWRTLFQLQRHVKVFHHNIREFKCEWCGKEFGEKNKLVCHVRIHTGEQPFRCNFAGCSRAFTHQTDLRRHVWGHVSIKFEETDKKHKAVTFLTSSLDHYRLGNARTNVQILRVWKGSWRKVNWLLMKPVAIHQQDQTCRSRFSIKWCKF